LPGLLRIGRTATGCPDCHGLRGLLRAILVALACPADYLKNRQVASRIIWLT